MLLDVRPDHLRIVQDILQKHVPQYEVWAFGSRAKWTAKEYSDLDLCIVSDKPLSFSLLGTLADEFSESDLPYKVDIVDWATTSPSFRKIIERDKVVLSGQEPCDFGELIEFGKLFATPQKNGLTRPKKVRGSGLPMVNMGELFAHARIKDIEMDLVPISDSEMSYLLEPGDLLFARQSLVREGSGQCAIFLGNSKPTVFESHLIRCRLNKEIANPEFYFNFFRSPSGRAVMETIIEQGAGASGIRGSDLVKLGVPFPTLNVQTSIAKTLSALDDKIALLRETNATLEAIAQAIFKSWFVDFDPVRAKMEGREPEGMDTATAALFPDSFEDSELGEIPKGWKVGTLGKLAALNPESWTARKHPDEIAYIDLANVKDNEVAAVANYVFDEAPSRARRVLRSGDTIVGTVRPGNRSFAFIQAPIENLTASTGFAVLRPLTLESTEFVYLAATLDSNIEHLAHVADGGAYPAVRPEVVAGLTCILPDEGVMRAFHEATSPLLTSIAENQRRAETLAALRDSLLPPLMSGKLGIPESEAA